MSVLRAFRYLYIKTTDFTFGYQGNKNKLKRFYKKWSKIYDFSVKLDFAYIKQLSRMIKENVYNNDTVLDMGCGTGISTIITSKIAEKVTAIDMSSDMLVKLEKKINKKNINNIKIKNNNIFEIIFDEKFDAVISSFAIVHFTPENREKLYQKLYSLLKKNGRIGLFTARGEIAAAFEKKDEIMSNLKKSGFKDININDIADIYRIISAKK